MKFGPKRAASPSCLGIIVPTREPTFQTRCLDRNSCPESSSSSLTIAKLILFHTDSFLDVTNACLPLACLLTCVLACLLAIFYRRTPRTPLDSETLYYNPSEHNVTDLQTDRRTHARTDKIPSSRKIFHCFMDGVCLR